MAVGDLYRVTMNYTNQMQECSNVFHYQQTSTQANAAPALSAGWYDDFFPKILAVAPELVTFQNLEVINLRVPSDYAVGSLLNTPGSRTAAVGVDLAPSWLAVQFFTARPYPGTRSGRKRFAFLYETDIEGNVLDEEFQELTALNNLAAGLDDPITDTNGSFVPAVVKAGYQIGNPLKPAVLSYLPTTWFLDIKVSSQDSRKIR